MRGGSDDNHIVIIINIGFKAKLIDNNSVHVMVSVRTKSKKINTVNTKTFRGLLWIQRHFLGNA